MTFNRSRLKKIWFMVMILTVAATGFKIAQGFRIESNILTLLPAAETDPAMEKALKRFNDNVGRKVVFLIGDDDPATAKRAASIFHRKMISAKIFHKISYRLDEARQSELFGTLFRHRRMLLSENQKKALEQGRVSEIIKAAEARLYGLSTFANSELLAKDPLFLFFNHVKESAGSFGSLNFDNGLATFVKDGATYVMISCILGFDPFSTERQPLFTKFLTDAESSVSSIHPSVAILSAGMIHHAAAGADSARRQISVIGIGSLVGIVLLIFMAFKTLRPLFLSLVPISCGLAAGLLACILVFGEIHLITLVFGASLIGVSIDYCFHWFAEQYSEGGPGSAEGILKRIFPGITLGLITSLIGYAALFIAPFPGLRQISLFASVGLTVSYLCVVFWFPGPSPACGKNIASPFKSLASGMIKLWESRRKRGLLMCGLCLFAIFSAAGLARLECADDVRMLQSSPPELLKRDDEIKSITGFQGTGRFFLIKGDTAQAVLEKEERIGRLLRQAVEKGYLSSFQAVSRVLPSAAEQLENYRLMKGVFSTHRSVFIDYFQKIGFADQAGQEYLAMFKPAAAPPLDIIDAISSPGFDSLNFLWLGRFDDGYASIVTLGRVKNPGPVEQSGQNISGVAFMDHVRDISRLLKRYRIFACQMVIAAYVLIFFLLVIRYKFKKACMVMLPPLSAAGFALAVCGWFQVPLNLFNTLALILVLGIGVDYTLFFAEKSQNRRTTMLAVTLSAITTILSFGLLAFSDIQVVRSFGLVVFAGISAAFLLSPVSSFRRQP